MQEENHTCAYCGAPATHQFKNGKWCCSKSRCSCPEFKSRHSTLMSGIHQKFKEKYGDGCFKSGRTIRESKHNDQPVVDHVCSYCGGYAEYQLKNGKWCCQTLRNKCPAIRRKNSEALKAAYKEGRRKSSTLGHPAWNKGLTMETDARVRQQIEKMFSTLKKAYGHGEVNTYRPIFNPKACAYMDRLNESMGWHLQHALNGGEVNVGRYFLDGYDKELNIAFEYDERPHYIDPESNKLKSNDIRRMIFIRNILGCRFFRYNEATDNLYEVV